MKFLVESLTLLLIFITACSSDDLSGLEVKPEIDLRPISPLIYGLNLDPQPFGPQPNPLRYM